MSKIIFTQATRNKARSIVRAAPGFDAWRNAAGDAVGQLNTKVSIIDAAKALNVWPAIEALIADQIAGGDHATDDGDDAAAIEDANEVDDVAALIEAGETDPVEAAIESVLAPVRPVLGSLVLQAIENAVRPIAVAANKPAVVIQAAPVAPAGAAPYAAIVRQSTMSQTFGLAARSAQGKLPVNIWDAVDAPTPETAYVVNPDTFAEVATALEHGEAVWLAGAAGTGKGTLAREYAARTNRPFVRIGFTRSTEIVDLVGQSEPIPGETHGAQMIWRDRVFTQSIRRPGTVILLDELMIAPPGTAAFFQTVLDDKRLTLPTGEVVPFAQGVVVIVADNSAGYGDETGVYAGVQVANAALVDRCARLVIVDYLPPALEALALNKHTQAPLAACERLAAFAKVVRTAAKAAGGEARPFSVRRLVAFVNATYRDKIEVGAAWRVTVLSRLPEADRELLVQAIAAHFDGKTFDRELRGVADASEPAAVAAPLSQASEQVGARQAFAS
jgi:MoxR-like ATPase